MLLVCLALIAQPLQKIWAAELGTSTIFPTGTEQRLLLGSSLGIAYGLAEARSSCSERVSEMTAFGHKQT